MSYRFLIAGVCPLAALVLGLAGCGQQSDTPLTADDKEELTAEIQELADQDGPEVDEARKSIPVPVYHIDLPTDDTFGEHGLDIAEVLETAAGMPNDDLIVEDTWADGDPQEWEEAIWDVADPMSTVFGSDDRRYLYPASHPWRTVGRVQTASGSCTGTLVGPRHVLTASHCVQWNANGTTGWMKFEPARYGSSALYGTGWASLTYAYRQDNNATNYGEAAFDFAVVVLDRRMGDSVGWMGSRTYTSSWNGGSYWWNVGYPGDMGSSIYPIYQSGCSVTSTSRYSYSSWTSDVLFSQCDVSPGQSGSPLFGFWSGSPSVVGVTSGENAYTNTYAGGSLVPSLVGHARNQYP